MVDARELEAKESTKSYKPSRYNHFYPIEGGFYLAYNAFSNSFAGIPSPNFEKIKQILETPDHDFVENGEYKKLKDDLIRGGFLIDYQLDEFAVLNSQNRIGRFANKVLNLTIAPTLACNFRCTYCFETPKSDTMDSTVEKAVIDFVDHRMEVLKELHVSWFGGEPLIRIDIIERLTEKFQEICDRRNAKFRPAAIVTNGYLLTKAMAKRLKQANIQSAQVTLDGIPEIHDSRRKLANEGKGGTFRKILENIKEACDLVSITVRVNVDKENAGHLNEFFQLWKNEGLAGKIFFYYGQVRNISSACTDNSFQCFNSKEYSQLILDLYSKTLDMEVTDVQYPSLLKYGSCCADNINGLVIAPNGYLFKCWEEISGEEGDAIGNLLTDHTSPIQTMNNVRYLNWDPFANEECKECSIFPVCGGGCVYSALQTSENKDCYFWKYNLNEMLHLKAKEISKKSRSNKGG